MSPSRKNQNQEAFEALGVYEDKDQRCREVAASEPVKIFVVNHNRLNISDGIRFGIGLFLAHLFIAAIFLLIFLLTCIFTGHSVDYYFHPATTQQQER